MAVSHQQRYRLRRMGQAYGKTRQEVMTLALLATESLLDSD